MKKKDLKLKLDRETVSRLDHLENVAGRGPSIISNCPAGCEPTFDAGTCGRTCNTLAGEFCSPTYTLCGTRYC